MSPTIDSTQKFVVLGDAEVEHKTLWLVDDGNFQIFHTECYAGFAGFQHICAAAARMFQRWHRYCYVVKQISHNDTAYDVWWTIIERRAQEFKAVRLLLPMWRKWTYEVMLAKQRENESEFSGPQLVASSDSDDADVVARRVLLASREYRRMNQTLGIVFGWYNYASR